jgi:hypothetical protein
MRCDAESKDDDREMRGVGSCWVSFDLGVLAVIGSWRGRTCPCMDGYAPNQTDPLPECRLGLPRASAAVVMHARGYAIGGVVLACRVDRHRHQVVDFGGCTTTVEAAVAVACQDLGRELAPAPGMVTGGAVAALLGPMPTCTVGASTTVFGQRAAWAWCLVHTNARFLEAHQRSPAARKTNLSAAQSGQNQEPRTSTPPHHMQKRASCIAGASTAVSMFIKDKAQLCLLKSAVFAAVAVDRRRREQLCAAADAHGVGHHVSPVGGFQFVGDRVAAVVSAL